MRRCDESQFFGIDIDIPDDPVAFIKGKVIELLNYLGYEWPTTNTSILDGWSEQWNALKGRLDSYIDDLETGLAQILATNEGAIPDAYRTYMASDESNLHSLKTISSTTSIAASAYTGASILITGLRAYVIGQILLDAVSLAAAIVTGGASAGASFLIKQGAGMLINIAIDQAISELLGGS